MRIRAGKLPVQASVPPLHPLQQHLQLSSLPLRASLALRRLHHDGVLHLSWFNNNVNKSVVCQNWQLARDRQVRDFQYVINSRLYSWISDHEIAKRLMKRVFENTAIACFKLAICNRRNYRIANFDETAPRSQETKFYFQTQFCQIPDSFFLKNNYIKNDILWKQIIIVYTY